MAGSRLVFSQIEPNWPLPYSTVPVPLLRDAWPAGWVNCFSICVSTMPRAQKAKDDRKRFNSQVKTKYIYLYSLLSGHSRFPCHNILSWTALNWTQRCFHSWALNQGFH